MKFPKAERLTSRQTIDQLFERGSASVQTFYLFPFRVLWLPAPEGRTPEPAEPGNRSCSGVPAGVVAFPAILITVPKRQFKRAVQRNLLRRRIREAYRINKSLLLRADSENTTSYPAYIAFLYVAKQEARFDEIEKGMKLALQKLSAGA